MREKDLKLPFGVKQHKKKHVKDDHEVHMAKSELLRLVNNSSKLLDIVSQIPEKEGLEGWAQAKITLAGDYIDSVLKSMEFDEYERSLAPSIKNILDKKE